jgi:hypothetical protein
VRAEHLVLKGSTAVKGLVSSLEDGLLIAAPRRGELDAADARTVGGNRATLHTAGPRREDRRHLCRRLTLTSGRFAMIDDGLCFALVPWTPTT